MESEETRRKAIDARREYGRRLGIAMGKVFFVTGLVLLFLSLVYSVFFRPVAVLFLCLGTISYITSKYEEWFYPKRKSESSEEHRNKAH